MMYKIIVKQKAIFTLAYNRRLNCSAKGMELHLTILNFGNLIILVFLRWDVLKLLLPSHHEVFSEHGPKCIVYPLYMSFQGSLSCGAEIKV